MFLNLGLGWVGIINMGWNQCFIEIITRPLAFFSFIYSSQHIQNKIKQIAKVCFIFLFATISDCVHYWYMSERHDWDPLTSFQAGMLYTHDSGGPRLHVSHPVSCTDTGNPPDTRLVRLTHSSALCFLVQVLVSCFMNDLLIRVVSCFVFNSILWCRSLFTDV